MSKTTKPASSGPFVVGRKSAEAISAVEGLTRSPRLDLLIRESDRLKETPEQLRARIRAEFTRKP